MADGETEKVDALQEIYPEPVTVKLASGTPVEVRALTILEIGLVFRALRVAAAAMNSGEDELLFLTEHAADLVPFVAASSGIDEAALSKAYGGDFMHLFAGALVANNDFFAHCFAHRFGAQGVKLVGMINGPGRRQSTISATAGIPTASDTRPRDSAGS